MVTLVCHPEQDQEFKVLSSKARLKPTWDTWDPISKRKKNNIKKTKFMSPFLAVYKGSH